MEQRGRKSQSQKESINIEVARQSPPEYLGDEERAVWVRIVTAMRPEWFSPENLDLLAQYCSHVVTLQHIRKEMREVEEIENVRDRIELREKLLDRREKEGRVMQSYATKMRITQQSTVDAEKRKQTRSGNRKPWE